MAVNWVICKIQKIVSICAIKECQEAGMKCRKMAKFCILLEARDMDTVSMCI